MQVLLQYKSNIYKEARYRQEIQNWKKEIHQHQNKTMQPIRIRKKISSYFCNGLTLASKTLNLLHASKLSGTFSMAEQTMNSYY